MSERKSRNEYFREYRAKNIEKMRAYEREYKRENRTPNPDRAAHYTAKRREQAATRPRPFMCEACDTPGPVVWDHCHTSGQFRGWLCGPCNKALGFVADSKDRMARLARYLDQFTAQAAVRRRR